MSPQKTRHSLIISLGSVLYAMATGRPPFRAETTYGILRRVTDDAPRAIRERHPEIPDWLEAIVLKLLRKSAAERFESAEEAAQLLEDCLAHAQQPTTFPLPQQVKAFGHAGNARLFGKAGLRITAAGLAFVVIAGIMLSVIRPGRTSDSPPKGDQTTALDDRQPQESAAPPASLPWEDGTDQSLKQLNAEMETLLEETTP